ncbi:hypothetical protein [Clostridium sp.]|uniref:hypothetical protein n=1 Tax=Clostridium sp. TaxID=1506 RepID=UPI003FD7DD68
MSNVGELESMIQRVVNETGIDLSKVNIKNLVKNIKDKMEENKKVSTDVGKGDIINTLIVNKNKKRKSLCNLPCKSYLHRHL